MFPNKYAQVGTVVPCLLTPTVSLFRKIQLPRQREPFVILAVRRGLPLVVRYNRNQEKLKKYSKIFKKTIDFSGGVWYTKGTTTLHIRDAFALGKMPCVE